MGPYLAMCSAVMPLATALVLTSPRDGIAQSTPAERQPLQLTLQSSLLFEDRRILVRLPRNYELDAAARYPVLYKFTETISLTGMTTASIS